MRLSKRQLRRIIKEEIASSHHAKKRLDVRGEPISSLNPEDYRSIQRNIIEPGLDPDEQAGYDEAEYQRGYEDGLDAFPIASDATLDYDAGYEDGKLDADLPEVLYDEVRSEDW